MECFSVSWVFNREIKEAFWIPSETEDEEPRTLWVQVRLGAAWSLEETRLVLVVHIFYIHQGRS